MYERIEQLLQKNKVTAYQLAKAIGVPQQTISSWKNGKSKPSAGNLKKVADFFGVSLLWLMGDNTELEPVSMDDALIRIPILGSVPAGVPIAAITDIEGYTTISAAQARSAEYFALRINGHSMEPLIHDGDVVTVRVQDTCDPGEVCIVSVNGEDATCKKVFWDESGVTLQSLNPEFPPLHYTTREVAELPVRIVGLVCDALTRIRR